MLHSGRFKTFALFSILIHLAFVLLFARVTLSFSPPPVRELSLTLSTRGGSQGEIVQSKAAWPMPRRAEPAFSAEGLLKSFDAEIERWTRFAPADPLSFSPRETLSPPIEIAEVASENYVLAPEELFSQLPPESKAMPIADFALAPVVPEISDRD